MTSQMKRRKKDEKTTKLRLDDLNQNISIADIEIKDLLYQPKSDLTTAVYGLIVKFVRKQLGFQHNSIINGAADEVIATMKDSSLDEESRRCEIDKLLSPDENLNDDDYNELCNLCKKIDDWDSNRAKVKEDTAEEETGVIGAIVSDDEEANSDEYLSEVRDSDDEFDLDEMFEKEKSEGDALNLEELAKKQLTIIPKIDIGEPIRKEGYHEYTIMPSKRRSHRSDELIQIEDLSEHERKAFKGLKSLNYIQSRIYKRAISSDSSLLICAPTGAGKTNIAMLTMLREILKHLNRDGSFETDKFKIIYIAPIKALVQEVVENFTKRLGPETPFKLIVEELTGDHQLNQKQISRAQIIVCTPEKWDIVTRKSLDRLYTKLVRLVIIDEIHLLHNDRGATLESLVARIKRHKSMEGEPIRIVGLSATLPNYKDVSRFISPDDTIENSTFYFDSSYRPIPMKQQYIALTESKKVFRMTNDIVYEKIVERLVDHSQILVFVHSRPDTVKTAEFLKTKALEEHKVALFLTSESSVEKINEYGQNLNPKLRELLQFGIGTHHAGMSKEERSCVEELFRSRYIRVLVSTATLAWGVNLPARTVIIKGTQVYRDGNWTDLDSLDVTQMLGRAGRPGYDREGEGIVITQQSKVAFYISLMTEQLPVESKLIGRLAEFINAECVVGNIESLEGAVSWLSETYLSSRMSSVMQQDNRQYMSMYGIPPEARNDDPKLTTHKHNLAYKAACMLDERGLIDFDRSSGAIRSTELGLIASTFNCSSKTTKMFYDSIHEYTSDIELFRIFSLADEFKDIFVRRGEEADLTTLINQVPYPIDDKRATPGANKVNVLLQVFIFRMNLEGSDLICDMHFIKDNAARLARAIHEIVLLKGYALVAELSLDLCRKIDLRMTICHTPLRQFADDLDADIINRLEKKNYQVDELRVLRSDQLIELLRCDRRTGERVYRMLKHLPKLKIEACVMPVSKSSLRVELSILPDFSWSNKYHGYSQRFWLLVEDVNQERLLHYEIVHMREPRAASANIELEISFHVPYLQPTQPFYYIRIFPENWFGCDHHLPIHIEKLTLPDEVSVSTQLLDLDPQTVRSLGNRLFELVYETKFRGADFNQIQTQSFNHLYNSDEDVILLAPAGSGKTICAELAIIHNINMKGTSSKCAYVAANSQAAKVVHDNWSKLFGQHYGVMLLTGNNKVDAARVDSDQTNVIIGDAENWHILSLTRSKKYRTLFNRIQVFIIDDIHQLHQDNGSILEWLCAKIRHLTNENTDTESRIVALGSPMIGAESLKRWLARKRLVDNATSLVEPTLLNFAPSIRPVKLELVIQKHYQYDYKMRLLTMQRPAYRHVNHIHRGKPALIFVPDYNRALELSESFVNYSRNENRRFVSPRMNFDSVREPLRSYLECGVGCIYSGMDKRDRELVEKLFDSEQIVVLIATAATCWSIQCRSYLTIIMDTQHHDGAEARDYKLIDLMQMVGLTGRPLADHECKCIIMCQFSKADYYERYLREPLPVESDLPANLVEHVNFEVPVGNIKSLDDIYRKYIAYSYFFKRISINPNYYGLNAPDEFEQRAQVFKTYLNKLVNEVARELETNEFLTMVGTHEEPKFVAGLLSKITLEYYISYKTLVKYNRWLNEMSDMSHSELIRLISTNTVEFDRIQVRHGELPYLKYLKRRYRLHDEGDQLNKGSFKVELLIRSQYQKSSDGREDKVEGELVEDRRYIITLSYRLLMAIVDIAWLKDEFAVAVTSIEVAKKLAPFHRSSRPQLKMEVESQKREDDTFKIEVKIDREDEPYSYDEFRRSSHLPDTMYRGEGWCFLISGQSRVQGDDSKKFVLFDRVRTPQRGENRYELKFELTDDAESYSYCLHFMSDFYSTSEDRRNVKLQAVA